MKKIFTLIAAAAMTANAMAQDVEIVKVDDISEQIKSAVADPMTIEKSEKFFVIPAERYGGKDFAAGTNADDVVYTDAAAEGLLQAKFTAASDNIEFAGYSSPMADMFYNGEWGEKAFKEENQAFWNMDEEEFEHKYLRYVKPGSGNPSLASKFYFELSADDPYKASSLKSVETLYTLGCGVLPGKGCMYEFSTKSAGTMELAVFSNRPFDHSHVVLNVTDMKEYTMDQISIKGVLGNRNKGAGVLELKLAEDLKFDKAYVEEHYPADVYPTLAQLNKVSFQGYMTFDVEANKKYYVFCPSQQLGFYGYAFTPNGASGIMNAKVEGAQVVRKSVVDGQVVILKDNQKFNIAGQLVK